ncbi:hypothetical protein K440DRAFT_627433 [Wilcoxina mikolae CBS 423.85]|nr:hypothetical protein K440DRAFT_627433 [Wilcoxina mikolae CBS 423.85]
MLTRLLIDPSREVLRLRKVLKILPILHPTTCIRFPKTLPRELFPLHRDEIVVRAWQELEEEHVHTPRFARRNGAPPPPSTPLFRFEGERAHRHRSTASYFGL